MFKYSISKKIFSIKLPILLATFTLAMLPLNHALSNETRTDEPEKKVWTPPKANKIPATRSSVVYFESNSYALSKDALKTLKKLDADDWRISKVELYGYADAMGSESYNVKLSKRRAHEVKAQLKAMQNFKEVKQWSYRFVGESNPEKSNESEWGRSRNRRVEVKVYYSPPNSQGNRNKNVAQQ